MEYRGNYVHGGELSEVELVGPMILSTVAREQGYNPHIVLGKASDQYTTVHEAVEQLNPRLVGFTVFTGNHTYVEQLMRDLRRQRPSLEIAVGGPHLTSSASWARTAGSYANSFLPAQDYEGLDRLLEGRNLRPPASVEELDTPRKANLLVYGQPDSDPREIHEVVALAEAQGYNVAALQHGTSGFSVDNQMITNFEPHMVLYHTGSASQDETDAALREFKQSRFPTELNVLDTAYAQNEEWRRDARGAIDYFVVSSGVEPLERILRSMDGRGPVVPKGVVIPEGPLPDLPVASREQFYRDSPKHGASPIKSVLWEQGCRFRCSYCNNTEPITNVKGYVFDDQLASMAAALNKDRFVEPGKEDRVKIFPQQLGTVDRAIYELDNIATVDQKLGNRTETIFIQDELFGNDGEWLDDLTKRVQTFRQATGFDSRFHAMARFEYYNPATKDGRRRLQNLVDMGFSGVTFAVESGDKDIRRELLDRNMNENIIFNTLAYATEMGLATRVFNIVGLPTGATKTPTLMNLEADLATFDFNARLYRETGGPNIAWASLLVPIPNTNMDRYVHTHGFYNGDFRDVKAESYRRDSVLRFAREWVGPSLRSPEEDSSQAGNWLNEVENRAYVDRATALMRFFPAMVYVPDAEAAMREVIEEPRVWEDSPAFEEVVFPLIREHVPHGDEIIDKYRRVENLTPEGANNAIRTVIYDRDLYDVDRERPPIILPGPEFTLPRVGKKQAKPA